MSRLILGFVGLSLVALAGGAEAATVNQQCGQQYQAAKAGGTLNGMTWNQFRSDCAAKLKAEPASTTAAQPATAANPLNPAPAAAVPAQAAAPVAPPAASTTAAAAPSTTPATGGRAAAATRQKACGAEWRANKVTLVAQTPGLTWPQYWHTCNMRMKAAGK